MASVSSARERTRIAFDNMKGRCYGTQTSTEYYQSKGITVCEEWSTFEDFMRDMGYCPDGLSLDRIDNDKGYSKDNCRWVSRQEQSINRRVTRFIEHSGQRLHLAEWARRLGDASGTIVAKRVQRGWDHTRAVTEPIRLYQKEAT